MSQITLTFPDGAKKAYASGTTGREVAEGISKSLAKRTVAMTLDGALADLADPITADATIKFISRTDPEALELIRHDSAHVLAEAVQELWPGTQVTIGPVIENGFFYDFAKAEPFHPDDLPKIEKKMREIIARNAPFTKEVWGRDKAKAFFKGKGELFKVELIDAIPPGEDLKIYAQGTWADLCRGPHMTSTGQIGNAFKLTKIRRRLLAWRCQECRSSSASTALPGPVTRTWPHISSRSRKPRSATTASSGARWTFSISRRRGLASSSGTRRAGSCSRT